jgi:hypothetical protein
MADRADRIRKLFLMQLKSADVVPAYTKAHDDIWPEMTALLKSHGVHNYSISLDSQTLTLYAYAEVSAGRRARACNARATGCAVDSSCPRRADRKRGALGGNRVHGGVPALVEGDGAADGGRWHPTRVAGPARGLLYAVRSQRAIEAAPSRHPNQVNAQVRRTV